MSYVSHEIPAFEKSIPEDLSKTLLVIPTMNEEEAIGDLISESRSVGFTNILVIDGFSSDLTIEAAKKSGAASMLQDFGKGKGCAVRTGMREFLLGRYEYLCIIDGDGTNIPSFLLHMISTAKLESADVVLGSRTRGPREKGAMNFLSFASNMTISFLLGIKFRRIFTDIQTGYWFLNRDAAQRMYPQIKSCGFEIELELFFKALRTNSRVREEPVGFRRRKGYTKFSFMLRLRNLYYALKFLAS